MARILITGSSSGIGRAAANRLSAAGHFVIATARRPESLDDLDVGMRLTLDVCDPEQIVAAVEAAGDIDVLINNAGVSLWGPLEICSYEDIYRVIATNLLGPIAMCRAVLPGMRARGQGKIIQISSMAARRPTPLLASYAAAKAGLEALSRSLRTELYSLGIPVTVVSMSGIKTSMEENRKVIDASATGYADIQRRTYGGLLGGVPRNPIEDVAALIEKVVDDPAPPFRLYVGESVSENAARIGRLTDAEFEAETLASLGY